MKQNLQHTSMCPTLIIWTALYLAIIEVGVHACFRIKKPYPNEIRCNTITIISNPVSNDKDDISYRGEEEVRNTHRASCASHAQCHHVSTPRAIIHRASRITEVFPRHNTQCHAKIAHIRYHRKLYAINSPADSAKAGDRVMLQAIALYRTASESDWKLPTSFMRRASGLNSPSRDLYGHVVQTDG